MGLKLVAAPTELPITLEFAKKHVRQLDTYDDAYLEMQIKAATANVEGWLGRALCIQTWDLYLDGFPPNGINGNGWYNNGWYWGGMVSSDLGIKIPLPPLIEVVSISYDQPDGTEATVDPTSYYVDNASEPGWVVPQGSLSWPTTIDAINSVRVRFKAGYESLDSPAQSAVPFDIQAGLLLLLGHQYENREEVTTGQTFKLPVGAENQLRKHRVLFGMA